MTNVITPQTSGEGLSPSDLPASNGLRIRPKRPARAVLALLLVIASVAAALTIYIRIGDRQEVLAATRTILAGQQLRADDFRVVAISSEDDLAVVPSTDLDALVGQYARVRIASGSLVVDSSSQYKPLVSADRVLMSVGVPVVGIPTGLREGSRIALIVTPGRSTTDGSQPVLIEAIVAAVPGNLGEMVGGESSGSLEVALSVEIPPERAALVGSADDVAIGVLDPSAPFPTEQVNE